MDTVPQTVSIRHMFIHQKNPHYQKLHGAIGGPPPLPPPGSTTVHRWFWERVSEWVLGFNVPINYRSFRRRVFPVNHLNWYWQPNKNNQETEHINNKMQKEALVNSTTDTLKNNAKRQDSQSLVLRTMLTNVVCLVFINCCSDLAANAVNAVK